MSRRSDAELGLDDDNLEIGDHAVVYYEGPVVELFGTTVGIRLPDDDIVRVDKKFITGHYRSEGISKMTKPDPSHPETNPTLPELAKED